MDDVGGVGDVWFHLIDGLVAMLLPTGDGIMTRSSWDPSAMVTLGMSLR